MLNLSAGQSVLDLACGTADLSIELARTEDVSVVALDFCPEMLFQGRKKVEERHLESKIKFVLGNAENLPFQKSSFDAAITGFALRDLDFTRALAEMHRVVKLGGVVVCLEMTTPPFRLFQAFQDFYLHKIVPRLGHKLSGDKDAYVFFSNSLDHFPNAEELKEIMEEIGFRNVNYELMNFSSIAIHKGWSQNDYL